MDYTTRRNLRIADALFWPGVAAGFVLRDAPRMGSMHALALCLIASWVMRKLGHALDGYRQPRGGYRLFFNPFNPLGWLTLCLTKLVSRREGEYVFFTLTLLKLAGLVVGMAVVQVMATGTLPDVLGHFVR
jgi:hypothetical protein